MQTRNSKRRAAGFTLVEFLIVLVLGLIVIGAVFGKALFGRDQANGSNEVSDITQVISATQSYKSAGTYGSSGTNLIPILKTGGAIPSDWSSNGSTATNSFGGPVTDTSTGTGFTVSTGGIPQSVCQLLAVNIAKQAVYSTSINGGSAIVGPVDAAAASTGCSSTTSNTIAWTSIN